MSEIGDHWNRLAIAALGLSIVCLALAAITAKAKNGQYRIRDRRVWRGEGVNAERLVRRKRKRWVADRRLCMHDAEKLAIVRRGRRMATRCMRCGKVLAIGRRVPPA